MRYYVMADIHAFYSPMMSSLIKAGYFKDSGPKKIIICGDLLDRGPEPNETVDFVMQHLDQDDIILIRGNHEDLLYDLANSDHGAAYNHHIHNGTYQTALALTHFDKVMASIRPYDFADKIHMTDFYRFVMPEMKNFHETDHYIFVHGWIPAIWEPQQKPCAISDWRTADENEWLKARWYNGMAAYPYVYEDKTIVCGHWHTSFGHHFIEQKCSQFGPDADFSPFRDTGIIALDACTAHSGVVNCEVIED